MYSAETRDAERQHGEDLPAFAAVCIELPGRILQHVVCSNADNVTGGEVLDIVDKQVEFAGWQVAKRLG